jgi:hypothetical protein
MVIQYNKVSLAITATLAIVTAFLNSDVAFLFSAAFFHPRSGEIW